MKVITNLNQIPFKYVQVSEFCNDINLLMAKPVDNTIIKTWFMKCIPHYVINKNFSNFINKNYCDKFITNEEWIKMLDQRIHLDKEMLEERIKYYIDKSVHDGYDLDMRPVFGQHELEIRNLLFNNPNKREVILKIIAENYISGPKKEDKEMMLFVMCNFQQIDNNNKNTIKMLIEYFRLGYNFKISSN